MKKPKPKAKKDGASPALSVTPGWASVETAPKDRVILADIGWPWPVPARWNSYTATWAVALMQCSEVDCPDSLDVWFETESEPSSALRAWMPMPSLPNKADMTKCDKSP
jgi:hypothetical protein